MWITAKTLAFIRTSVDLDQTSLGKASGVSRGMIGAIERGEKVLSTEIEKKIRKAIGLSDTMIGRLIEIHWEVQKDKERSRA